MADPLAAVTELQARLDWDMDEGEQAVAEGALEDLSDDARFYGTSKWSNVSVTPQPVRNLILRAAARYVRNPDGYSTSRAGDETLQWKDRKGETPGSPEFTPKEIRMLASLAFKASPGIYSVETVAWGPVKTGCAPGYIPVSGPSIEKPFPMFSNDENNW